jgi:hypothetical protein
VKQRCADTAVTRFPSLWLDSLSPVVRPRTGAPGLTSQGHPHAIFRRAIDAGNVVAAEIAALELRGLSLTDALDLIALVALRPTAVTGVRGKVAAAMPRRPARPSRDLGQEAWQRDDLDV